MHRHILGALCGILIPVLACAQAAEFLAREELEGRVARLSGPQAEETLGRDAAALMTGLGLTLAAPIEPDAEGQAFKPNAKAVVELVDIRLLLTRIAVQAGAKDHAALIRAQGDRDHDVILLRGGLIELHDLLALAKGTAAAPFLSQTAEGIVLTRPLAIWDDAGLALSSGDTLVLDRQSGSFIANLGQLAVTGGAIRGSAGVNGAEAAFRPFVLTAGQGSFTAQGARFSTLGFDPSVIFGGLAVVSSGLIATRLPSFIMDSTISDVASIAIVGTTSTAISGNRIIGSAGSAVLLSHATSAVVSGNRFTGRTGTRAIRVTAISSGVMISGNLLSQGPGIGVLIDGGSDGVALSGNVVLGSGTSGIEVRASECVIIEGNLVAMNEGTGININDTRVGIVSANAILFNRGSGVLLRDQAVSAMALVSDNVIAGNRDGLRGATAGRVELSGNKLDGQLPRVFAGDLAPLAVDWLRHRRNPEPAFQPATQPAAGLAPCEHGGNG